jgi:hypothetical protein
VEIWAKKKKKKWSKERRKNEREMVLVDLSCRRTVRKVALQEKTPMLVSYCSIKMKNLEVARKEKEKKCFWLVTVSL